MKKINLLVFALLTVLTLSSFKPSNIIKSSQIPVSKEKNFIFKRYTLHTSATIPWGDCDVNFQITIVMDWDGVLTHPPKVVSTTVTSWGMSCPRNSTSCLPVIESYTFDESSSTFSNIKFSSNCPNDLDILNSPSVTAALEQNLTNAVSNFIVSQ